MIIYVEYIYITYTVHMYLYMYDCFCNVCYRHSALHTRTHTHRCMYKYKYIHYIYIYIYVYIYIYIYVYCEYSMFHVMISISCPPPHGAHVLFHDAARSHPSAEGREGGCYLVSRNRVSHFSGLRENPKRNHLIGD